MVATDTNRIARQLFDGLPRRYDLLADLLSFGQNARWRRAMVNAVVQSRPPSGARLLDVATGTAGVALQLAARAGRVTVVGVDLTPEMLRLGAAKVKAGRADVVLALAQAERLPFADATFDALTFTYLLRYVEDMEGTLKELARVVKPGGAIANLEFHVPAGPLWGSLWRLYTAVGLPLAGLAFGGHEWQQVGRFLGPSISGFYHRHPMAEQLAAWEAAGIEAVTARTMSLGGGVVICGRRVSATPGIGATVEDQDAR